MRLRYRIDMQITAKSNKSGYYAIYCVLLVASHECVATANNDLQLHKQRYHVFSWYFG